MGNRLRHSTVLAAITAVALLTGCTSPAASTTGPTETAHDDLRATLAAAEPVLDAYVDRAFDDWGLGAAAVGVVIGDELVWERTLGRRADGQPVDAETRFEIGSTTKALLGATLAQTIEIGALDWTDRVVEHIPDFELADAAVTADFRIRDLLAQRSGLPESANTALLLLGGDAADAVERLRHVPPVGTFRQDFAYQNALHLVAGRLVAEHVGADSWADAADALLLGPLGMHRSGADARLLTDDDNAAVGHQRAGDTNARVAPAAFPTNAAPSGGLISTLDDLRRWVGLHLSGGIAADGTRIIGADTLAATYEPLVAVPDEALGPGDRLGGGDYPVHYATGWYVHDTPEGRILHHDGLTMSFAASIALDLERGYGVIALTDLAHVESAAVSLTHRILDTLQGRDPVTDYSTAALARSDAAAAALGAHPATPAEWTPPAEVAAGLVGRYTHPILGPAEIEVDDDGRVQLTLLETGASGLLRYRDTGWLLTIATWPQHEANPVLHTALEVVETAEDGSVVAFTLDVETSGVAFRR